MAKVGRKTKRKPSLQDDLLDALKVGHIDADACALVGINPDTFYDWIKKFPDFSDAVCKARLKAKDQSIKIVRKAALTNWQAATWWLSRRGGFEFVPKQDYTGKVDLTSKGQQIEGVIMVPSPKAIEDESPLETTSGTADVVSPS